MWRKVYNYEPGGPSWELWIDLPDMPKGYETMCAGYFYTETMIDQVLALEATARRAECKAPVIQYDPDCDHDSDPIEKALYIVADNIVKHTMTGKHWDCRDTCWLEALEEARAIIRNELEAKATESRGLEQALEAIVAMAEGCERIENLEPYDWTGAIEDAFAEGALNAAGKARDALAAFRSEKGEGA